MSAEDEVRARVEELYTAMSSADGPFIHGYLAESDDVVVLGTDPDEWWEGHDDAARVWAAQLGELEGLRIEAGPLRVRALGDVAWVVDRPSVVMPDGSAGPPLRMTAVLARGDDGWRAVHSHASIGVPNAEVFDEELTMS